jgi:hypothetical protein
MAGFRVAKDAGRFGMGAYPLTFCLESKHPDPSESPRDQGLH